MALTAEEQALASSPLQFNFAHMYCSVCFVLWTEGPFDSLR